jgi:hypothetical protein
MICNVTASAVSVFMIVPLSFQPLEYLELITGLA